MHTSELALRAAIRGARTEAELVRFLRAHDGRRWRIICEEMTCEQISNLFALQLVNNAGLPALAALLTRPEVKQAVRDVVLDAIVINVRDDSEEARIATLMGVVALGPQLRAAIAARLAPMIREEETFKRLGVWRAVPLSEIYLQIEDDIDEKTLLRMMAAYRSTVRLTRAIAFHPAAGRRVWRKIAQARDTEGGDFAAILLDTSAAEDPSIRRLLAESASIKVLARLIHFAEGDECQRIAARLLEADPAAAVAALECLDDARLQLLSRTLLADVLEDEDRELRERGIALLARMAD